MSNQDNHPDTRHDARYLDILLRRIQVSATYRPKFGQGGQGLSLREFRELYSGDLFYAWFGLDNPRMYAAHRAAGGMTSVYRQIGIGGETLFKQLLQDHLGLSPDQATWSYHTTTASGRSRTLKLDGRVEVAHVAEDERRQIISDWIQRAAVVLEMDAQIAAAMKGIVFEVRQGYKSKDSKRQNADIANAAKALTQGYLPVLLMLSNQIDSDVVERYQHGEWLVLRGVDVDADTYSTYAFVKAIIGYDLKAFFERHHTVLAQAVNDILGNLLKADDNGETTS